MKKFFFYFFVACLFVSCNQGTDKNIFNQNKNTTTTTWSKDFSDKFISDCVNSATSGTGALSKSQAQSYCACMADKISKKYPNENDAEKMTKEDVENLKGGCLTNQTNNNPNQNNPNQNNPYQNNPNQNNPNQNNPNQNNPNQNNPTQKQWSNDDQSTFLQTCISSAMKRMDGGSATQLCDCIMQKLMQKFPNREAANNAYTQEYDAQLEKECMGTGIGRRK